ncbi:MAG: formate dehydrogenase subunit alpha [Thermodesulfobacteriota bacterium]|nr:formate dehydrogenase subunit alpha [Thermodesulfobacteriota bacterium]
MQITVDGKELEFNPGQTIYEVAKENNIHIPVLCHYEQVKPIGACRVCVVEVERARTLIPSCCTPAEDGMVVYTNTNRVLKSRKLTVELLISMGHHNCMTCESNRDCVLQDLAYEMGIEMPRFEEPKERKPIEDANSMIIRDMNKCVLCGLCVRVCQEIQVNNILDYSGRGPRSTVGPAFNMSLEEAGCKFCGACIQACPVGALSFKQGRFGGRTWEVQKVQTTCPHCGVGCQIELWVKDGKIKRVYGVEEDNTENKGQICVKSRFGLDFVHSPERLTRPLIKKDGKFKEASWDEALDLVVTNFRKIKKEYGSDALGGIASSKSTNEECYLFQKFIRSCLGTNNVDFCTRFCHTPSAVALSRAFGGGAMTNSMRLVEKADVVLIAGLNFTEMCSTIGALTKHLVQFGNLKLIVVDPRGVEIADYAKVWLRPNIGTDIAWANGMMNVIINEDLYDHDFVEKRTEKFNELKKLVSKYTPEKVEEITGIPKEEIIETARLYAKADKASVLYGMGVTQHIYGTDNVSALCNLALLTGNVGKEGTGVNTIAKQNNGQGAGDMGCLPPIYPGGQPISDPKVNKKFEEAWGVKLSMKPGVTESDMVINKGKIKGLYVVGGNPMRSGPNLNNIRKVLEDMTFIVVQDMFLSETAQVADVVLPACSFAEKDGTFTNTARLIQRVRKAIDPIGESKPDWEIICELSKRMGYEMSYTHPREIMNEIASLVPPYGGVSYERLEDGGLRWPCPNKDHPGTLYLWKDKFNTKTGKGFFFPADYNPPAELPDKSYPFVFTTGKDLCHLHTGSYTRHSAALLELSPEDLLAINPLDAQGLDVKNGDKVKVSSRRGEIKINVRITDRVPKGTVFSTLHSSEIPVNVLTIDTLDPLAKTPELKICAVNIKAV